MACLLSALILALDAANHEKMAAYEEKHAYWIANIAFQLIVFADVNRRRRFFTSNPAKFRFEDIFNSRDLLLDASKDTRQTPWNRDKC
jgi:hypothetical protein